MKTKIKVYAPLINFDFTTYEDINLAIKHHGSYKESEEFSDYTFNGGDFTIENFELDEEKLTFLKKIDFLSKEDIEKIESAKFTLMTEVIIPEEAFKLAELIDNISQKFVLFQMATHISFETHCNIKFICNFELANLFNNKVEEFLATKDFDLCHNQFTMDDIKVIDNVYTGVKELFVHSNRSAHAIQFLYLGFTQYYFLSAFVLLIAVLDTLFLPEKKEDEKETVNSIGRLLRKRVVKFIRNKKIVQPNDLYELYNLRSDIIHGNIKVRFRREEVFPRIEKIKIILRTVILKIIEEGLYREICGEESIREDYFNNLTGTIQKTESKRFRFISILFRKFLESKAR